MREILWRVPAYRRHFRVEFAANGNPEDQEAIARIADSNTAI